MDMDTPQPSWQRSPCPGWCPGGHREEDLRGDRVHRSTGEAEPIRARRVRVVDGEFEELTGSEEFEAGLSVVDGGDTTWLYIGAGGGQQMEIDLRDLPRLRALIARTVGED